MYIKAAVNLQGSLYITCYIGAFKAYKVILWTYIIYSIPDYNLLYNIL